MTFCGIHSMFLCRIFIWPRDLRPYVLGDILWIKLHTSTHTPILASYDYPFLSYGWLNLITITRNRHCACTVSRDQCIGGPPKPHITIFWPRIIYSLDNFYGATMTIKGSFILERPHVEVISAARKRSPVKIGPQNGGFSQIKGSKYRT